MRTSTRTATRADDPCLVSDWSQLLASCLSCGADSNGHNWCEFCGLDTRIAARPATGVVGRLASIERFGRDRDRHLVIDNDDNGYVLLDRALDRVITPADRVVVEEAAFFPTVGTHGGELLAAASVADGDLTATLRRLARDEVRGDVAAARALIHDAIRLDQLDFIDGLAISRTETLWWTAIAAWSAGEFGTALTAFLALPPGAYRQRLMYFVAAPIESLFALPRTTMRDMLVSFDEGPEWLAAALVRARIDDSDAGRRALIAAAAGNSRIRTVNGTLGGLLTGASGSRQESRLLGGRFHHASRLGSDPAVLRGVPVEILDDLIDLGRVPTDWAAGGGYLEARLDISRLDTARLEALGARAELARRHYLAHGSLPGGVSRDVQRRLAPFVAPDGAPPNGSSARGSTTMPPPMNLERRSGDSAEQIRRLQHDVISQQLTAEIGAVARGVPKLARRPATLVFDAAKRRRLPVAVFAAAAVLVAVGAIAGVATLLDDDPPATEVLGASTGAATGLDPSDPPDDDPTPSWGEGTCVVFDEAVATPTECGPDTAVVDRVLPHASDPLGAGEVQELEYGLGLLGVDVDPETVGNDDVTTAEATEILGLSGTVSDRALLAALRAAAQPASAEALGTLPVRTEPPWCGGSPYVERIDGTYCLSDSADEEATPAESAEGSPDQ